MVSIALDITFFIQMGLFLVCMYVLNVLVYRPVLKVIEDRAKKISDLETNAETVEADVESRLSEYRQKIDGAKEEGNRKRNELKKAGLEKEAEVVGAAHAEAQETISRAKSKIDKEKETALKALRDMSEEMGREIAAKALGRSL